ncbi:MAG: hypothetical protein IPK71_00060 [Myxococcales bacterium]|nr:hypothetical protein [Myxococcales bacterium]
MNVPTPRRDERTLAGPWEARRGSCEQADVMGLNLATPLEEREATQLEPRLSRRDGASGDGMARWTP